VGEYRRRVGRAIEEFVRWVEDPGTYAFRTPARAARAEPQARKRPARPGEDRPRSGRLPPGAPEPISAEAGTGLSLDYPLRPDLLAQVVVPRDLTVEEARRMGAFLVTLAVDFRPAEAT
jgi:hypothetical protein